MADDSTRTLAGRLTDSSRPPGGFSNLSPELQQQQYRRLGGVALVYAGAWFANYLFAAFTSPPENRAQQVFMLAGTAGGVTLGTLIYLLCRSRKIPPDAFANTASLFEVVGGFGIMTGFFGWESYGVEFATRVATVLGLGTDPSSVVQPLAEHGPRLLYFGGVTWVSVWLLVFPLVVPSPMSRTITTSLLTAATAPITLLLSLMFHGIPKSVSPWVWPFFTDVTVPTFICAGIAIVGSRVVYTLTRQLSKAQELGSYRLIEKIGTGGMGEVWKAQHQMLVRLAAIKLIRSETLGGHQGTARTALKRFEREAQATSTLSSPHSIELYDFGITNDGTFFYVMELLQGLDLRTLVERHGPLPSERIVYLLSQMCHSLMDAHAMGIVHRDIKPGNVFICRRGLDLDFVKVLDFGLVKHVHETTAHLTIEGVPGGTPAFMSPEMAADAPNVDARADLYAVGCVAYWLLTGTLVFDGTSPMSILLQHAKDPPRPPSTRTELAIPASLEALIMRCLEKDPAARPQSARELSDALLECARTLPPWTPGRARRWWKTHLPHLAQGVNAQLMGVAPVRS